MHELPSTLSQTTDTLNRVDTFAELLGPTTEKLRPAARALAPANEAVRPFAKEATPQLRKSIRPFVRESRPLVRDLRPVSTRAAAKPAPNLTQVFLRFNHFLNLLGYNPNGKEGPSNAARQEGYLFWLAWLNHSATQLFSNSDANGVVPPGHDRGAVRDARAGAAGAAVARVHLGADAAADRLARRATAAPTAATPRSCRRRARSCPISGKKNEGAPELDADLRPPPSRASS